MIIDGTVEAYLGFCRFYLFHCKLYHILYRLKRNCNKDAKALQPAGIYICIACVLIIRGIVKGLLGVELQ